MVVINCLIDVEPFLIKRLDSLDWPRTLPISIGTHRDEQAP